MVNLMSRKSFDIVGMKLKDYEFDNAKRIETIQLDWNDVWRIMTK
jgi:hypothetical protein